MRYQWIDYTSEYGDLVASWIDPEAMRFTGLEDEFDDFYRYWATQPGVKPGENYWAKLILDSGTPVGVIALGVWEGVFTVQEFPIRPDRRGRQLGSCALSELLARSEHILGVAITEANAVIFPGNLASQKAFEHAGFVFHSAHPDGDAWNYHYENTQQSEVLF